jgi:hypothetical protein
VDAVAGGAIARPEQHVGLFAAVADHNGGTISEGAIDVITPLRFSRHGEPASRLSRADFRHATQVIGGHDLKGIDTLHVGRAPPWFKCAGPVARIPPRLGSTGLRGAENARLPHSRSKPRAR